jgi:hypothetical protein
MNWDELQTEIFDIVSDADECSAEKAKQIVDLIERRIAVPDSAVMRIADLQRQLAELRDKLRWIPVECW